MTNLRVIPPNAVWVFDFDQTITSQHTGGTIIKKPFQYGQAMAEHNMLHIIKPDFWDALVQIVQYGGHIVIASYSDSWQRWWQLFNPLAISGARMIRWAIKLSAGEAPIDERQQVFSRLHIIAKFSRDEKKYHLKQVSKLHGVTKEDAKRVIIFDDVNRYVGTFRDFGATLFASSATETAEISAQHDLFTKIVRLMTYRENLFPVGILVP